MFDTKQAAYLAFRELFAERTTSVVAWVGAGVSRDAALPTWSELRTKVCDAFDDQARSLGLEEAAAQRKRLTKARGHSDLWTAFQLLDDLGSTTYKQSIRAAFGPAANAKIPLAYESLWKLRLGGMLTLNLDRLAARSFAAAFAGRQQTEFSGFQAGQYTHALKAPNPFIVNLHGTWEDVSQWVLTVTQLNALLSSEGYLSFLRSCLSSRTVLLVGISADDKAVARHFEAAKAHNIDLGSHFWLTSRRDAGAHEWAENNGVRIIHYDEASGDHTGVQHFLSDLLRFVPSEESAPPVTPVAETPTDERRLLPTPKELLTWASADEIRQVLNHHAAGLLAPQTPEAYAAYEGFCREYDEVLHRAWYVKAGLPLMGYLLESEIARGSFGRVFLATAPSGDTVALKLLHEDIRDSSERLQSFRRGVRSMHILSERNVEGMVPYRSAAEIPTFVVMDFVEGPNLAMAVRSKRVEDWSTILRIADDLAATVRRAHRLPERVLHRDIKPSNVMLKGFDSGAEWSVVLLDFDLSWHRDAPELSILSPASVSGYLAPEQVVREASVSTRNAAVDSFGLGMTLFFLVTGHDPMFSQHRHKNWSADVTQKVCEKRCKAWRSLPTRFARLILESTRHEQVKRWDMAQIEGEIQRLREAEAGGTVDSAELIAEEIYARAFPEGEYSWNSDRLAAGCTFPGGTEVSVKADESKREVELMIHYADNGAMDRRHIGKWIGESVDRANACLKRERWSTRIWESSDQNAKLTATAAVTAARGDLDRMAAAITEALDHFRFS